MLRSFIIPSSLSLQISVENQKPFRDSTPGVHYDVCTNHENPPVSAKSVIIVSMSSFSSGEQAEKDLICHYGYRFH